MTQDLYDRLWNEVESSGHGDQDVFSYFQIPNFIPSDASNSEDLTESYLNYTKQHKRLLAQFIGFAKKSSKGSKKILLIGPSGSGKTSFFFFFQKSFHNLLHRNKIDEKVYDIPQTTFATSAKALTIKETLVQIERNEKRFLKGDKKNIIFLDDIQEVLCPVVTESPEIQRTRAEFWKKVDSYQNCFIIMSSTPYNWAQTVKFNPSVTAKFDDTILLDGLGKEHLGQLAHERVYSHLKDNAIIPNEIKNKIIEDANNNPRLLLRIIKSCLEIAFKNKQQAFNADQYPIARSETGLTLVEEFRDLPEPQQELLMELTSQDAMSATDVSEKTNLTRSTISTYLNELERRNFLQKKKEKKEMQYSLSLAVKVFLEKKMIVEDVAKQ